MSQSEKTTQRLAPTPEDIARAAEILRDGGTVAFPTETVYGLGANALDSASVEAIFSAKQRPHWDPLIVHVSNRAMLNRVATLTSLAERLTEAFWPGPLTLLLPRTDNVPDAITAGRPLVGVRMPEHPIALALIEAAGIPVAAPSANRFGHTSPTTAAHVLDDLDHRIDAVLDGGPTSVGLESTVLDPAAMVIYRPGAVTAAMIEAIIPNAGPVAIYQPERTPAEPESLPSPGVGIRHYAPRARLILVADQAELNARLKQLFANETQGETTEPRVGVMLPEGWAITTLAHPVEIYPWNSFDDNAALAQTLFSGLRELDHRGVSVILCPRPSSDGVGLAILDRLQKASK